MTDTITIDRVQDGLRVLLIAPPLFCQARPPMALAPFWRVWVDALDTTITAPSRALLPAAIGAAVAEAWHRYADRGDLITVTDQCLFTLLQTRVHATSLLDDRQLPEEMQAALRPTAGRATPVVFTLSPDVSPCSAGSPKRETARVRN